MRSWLAGAAGFLILVGSVGFGQSLNLPDRVVDCPPSLAGHTESRLVMQVIEGVFHKWREYDLGASGQFFIVQEAPISGGLTAPEARALLVASAGWKQGVSQELDAEVDARELNPSQVIGSDDRTIVQDPTEYPWNTIAQLVVNPGMNIGSGFLVSPHMLLTCAHNVIDVDGSPMLRVHILLARSAQDVPFGKRTSTAWSVPAEYNASIGCSQKEHDYAAVYITEPFAGISTFMPLMWNATPTAVEVVGYHSNVFGWGDYTSNFMWRASGAVRSVESRLVTYYADSTSGASGSPVITMAGGARRVVGIHTYKCFWACDATCVVDPYNGGTRLVTAIQDRIEQWMKWEPARLRVLINPPEVRGTGKWRVTSGDDTSWKLHGEIVYLLGGTYTLEFMSVDGWVTPASRNVATSDGVLTTEYGEYTCRVPQTPLAVAATDGTRSDAVRISWNQVPEAVRYEVWRGTVAGGGTSKIGETTATYYDDATALPRCTSYWYRVKACSVCGCSSLSAGDGGWIGSGLSVPACAASDGAHLDRVRVTWNSVPTADKYEIWRALSSGGPYQMIGQTAGTSYDDVTATPCTTYWYAVRACAGSCGCTGMSVPDAGFAGAGPAAPTGASASPSAICVGQSTTLTATGGSGTTLRWLRGSCGGTPVGTGNGLVVSPMTTTTYYARWENACGNSACVGVTVTVSGAPVAPTGASASPPAICPGQSTTLTATGGSGTTLRWLRGSCGGTPVGTGNGLVVSPTATTTYYARWENACGNSTCASVTVTVNLAPVAPTGVSANPATVKPGQCSILTATGGAGTTLRWFEGDCGGPQVGTGNNVTVCPTVTTTYFARWENTCGGSDCGEGVTVTVVPCSGSLNPSTWTAPRCGGEGTVNLTVETECGWAASSDRSWLTVTPPDGKGSAVLTLEATPNFTGNPRTATVTVVGTGGAAWTATVSVTQAECWGAFWDFEAYANQGAAEADGWQFTGLWRLVTEDQVRSFSPNPTPFPSPVKAMYFGNTQGNYATLGTTGEDLAPATPELRLLQAGAKSHGMLTSPAVSVAGLNWVELSFRYYRVVEYYPTAAFDRTIVEVSFDGGPWQEVWSASSKTRSIPGWNPAGPFKIAVPTGAQALQVRSVFDSVDQHGNNFLGWLIDDVRVQGTVDGALFTYSDLVVTPMSGRVPLPITVTARVRNTGTTAGTERVRLFVNGVEQASQLVNLGPGGSATVSFPLTFGDPGTYAVTIDALAPVTVQVSGTELHRQSFEAGMAGWQADGLWHLATGSPCFPCSPLAGNYAYYAVEGKCNYSTGARTTGQLTSPAFPLQGAGFVQVRFDQFRHVEYMEKSPYDRVWLEVNFGSTWVAVWSRTSQQPSPDCGAVTVGPFAVPAGATTMQVRFVFDSLDKYFNAFPGWAVDNVSVAAASSGQPLTALAVDEPIVRKASDVLSVLNIPNPVRDVRTTRFVVRGLEPEMVRVEVYDLAGRLVYRAEETASEIVWHTQDLTGLPLANGVYLYTVHVRVDGEWITVGPQKLVILR